MSSGPDSVAGEPKVAARRCAELSASKADVVLGLIMKDQSAYCTYIQSMT
jgi:hypothetical protein